MILLHIVILRGNCEQCKTVSYSGNITVRFSSFKLQGKKISHLKMNTVGFLTALASALHVIATCHLFFTGNKKGLIPSERTLSGKGSCWPNASRPQWPRLRPQAWSKTNAKAKPMEQRAKRMMLYYNISSF